MSEEQLKVAEKEAMAEQEEGSGEEISGDDLKGVAGGYNTYPFNPNQLT